MLRRKRVPGSSDCRSGGCRLLLRVQVSKRSSGPRGLTSAGLHNNEKIVACGRARWKCENEGYNVLEQNGFHLEHSFGHGKNTLASVLLVMNFLAFMLLETCDLFEATWQEARKTPGARICLFEHIRSITGYLAFPTWETLFNTLITGIPQPLRG